MGHRRSFGVLAGVLGVAAALAYGCGTDATPPSVFQNPDSGGEVPNPFDDGGGDAAPDSGGVFDDFPTPVVDTGDAGAGAPQNAAQLFGDADAGAGSGGPCLFEPEVGSLYPHNWLRPRFSWTPSGGENLFEIRLHVANQKTDLVVYTTQTSWTMPQATWDLLRNHSADEAMTLSIRGGVFDGQNLASIALGTSGPLGVAPVDAPGSIVYWWIKGSTGLKGFSVGDETVVSALTPPQVQSPQVQCFGCHTGTPDGNDVMLSAPPGNWGNLMARVDPGDGGVDSGLIGTTPSYLGAGAATVLQQGPLGITSFSKAHWTPGDRTAVASDGTDLVWLDVEAKTAGAARGVIPRQGTAAAGTRAAAPSFSHDGATVVYTATNHTTDGRLGGYYQSQTDNGSRADLYTVPYNARAGGAVAPVAGASDPKVQEYYPSFSPDDAWIAYTEAPNDLNMYNQQKAEVYVVPAAGGTAVRLAANDPPACSGGKSPGVTNSWPKWAPSVGTSGGRTYYWIVFSSTRQGTLPQLFITPVVVEGGKVTTYAALYLWNQPADEGNHTPAWEYFKLPPPPPPN